jgi:hypothetical protein
MDPSFTQTRKPWRLSHIVVGLIILSVGGYWLVQVLRHGAFVPDASNVTSVISSKPAAGDRAVPVSAAITANLNPGHSVDPATLDASVRLFRANDLAPVVARVTTPASGGEIVVTPLQPLAGETKYTLEIRGAKDADGADVLPYVMSFTTGVAREETQPKASAVP